MIKQEYFPTQEVPSRVKDRVMKNIYGPKKTFRLLSLIRYKIMVPTLAFFFIVMGGYLYLQMPKKIIVSTTSGDLPTISTTTVQTTTVVTTTQVVAPSSDEDALQQKLAEAESALTTLSTVLNQEQDITL